MRVRLLFKSHGFWFDSHHGAFHFCSPSSLLVALFMGAVYFFQKVYSSGS